MQGLPFQPWAVGFTSHTFASPSRTIALVYKPKKGFLLTSNGVDLCELLSWLGLGYELPTCIGWASKFYLGTHVPWVPDLMLKFPKD
jgi:hypothetical protein